MTCIVAVRGSDRIVLGGDSAGVSGYNLMSRKDAKVFVNGHMAIGFTTSFRFGQVLMDMKIPKQRAGRDDFQYMRTSFIDAVQSALEQKGALKKESEVKSGGEFITVYRGEIYKISDDFQVEMAAVPYNACGCGEPYAIGALAEMGRTGYPTQEPREACLRALQIAEQFSGGVRAPFRTIEILPGEIMRKIE